MSLGAMAVAMVSVLGTKAVLVIPALVVAVILTLTPYSMLYMVIGTIPVNVEIAGPITVARLVIVFSFCVAIVQALRHQAPFPRVFIWPEGSWAAAFFIWMLISTIANGVDLILFGPLVILAAIFFVILNYVDNAQRLFNVILLFACVGAIQALLVLAEVKLGFKPFGGWQAELAKDQAQEEIRVTGSSVHPIFLAGFFQIIVAFSVMLAVRSRHFGWRVAFLSVTALALISWWFTYSRSSWIGMGLMFFSGMVLASRPTRILGLVLGSVGFVVLWIFDFSPSAAIRFVENFGTVDSVAAKAGLASGADSFSWRTENWAAALRMFAESPVFGVGLDGTLALMQANLPFGAVGHQYIPVAVPHNMFLQILAEGGLVSLVTFAGLWVFAFRSAIRSMSNPALRLMAMAILAAMIGQIGTFMFNPTPREIWLTMGLAIAAGRIDRRMRPGPGRHRTRPNPPPADPRAAAQQARRSAAPPAP